MFYVIKLKTIFKMFTYTLLVLGVVLSAMLFAPVAVQALQTSGEYTVVLDPGHGGIDAGVIGAISKSRESDINLLLSKKVKRLLSKNNINVVLTRETKDGLYGEDMTNFKRRDMAKRKQIIEETAPDLMVSIHCNKFPDASRRGAQVFFEETLPQSISVANTLQATLNLLNEETVHRSFAALKGDYYMLKCTTFPSAIIECGFLSNPDDDRLLNDKDYQDKIAYQIFLGITSYLRLTKSSSGESV